MNYKYRVTLSGIKGFFRVYTVNSENSLYSFHKQLRFDLEFPVDQPILFKALDSNGNVVARYALVDIGFGSVDNVKISDTIKAGVSSFVYFYDTKAKKSVTITLEGESDVSSALPKSLEAKGPVPAEFENGYVAFEDLPEERRRPHHAAEEFSDDNDEDEDEDDEEDEEDEENDREEEELIYDEKE